MKLNQQADFERKRERLFLIVGERKVFSEMILEVFIGHNNGRDSIVVVDDFEEAVKKLNNLTLI